MNEAEIILTRLKNQGRRIIGCFPLYAPLELLHSFGLTPVVLWGERYREKDLSRSDSHLQNYTCRIGRNLTEFILRRGSSLLDGLFMYNACDTLRNLPEIIEAGLIESGTSLRVFRLHVPAVPGDRSGAVSYLSERIRSLIAELESFTLRPFSEKDFLASATLYQAHRGMCRRVERLCASGKIPFSACAMLLELAHLLPVEEHMDLLEQEISRLSGDKDDHPHRVNVILSGIQSPPAALLELVDASGMCVVANDIATLSRSYGCSPTPCADPCEYYRDFYFNCLPCPTVLFAGDKRALHIRQMAEAGSAQGFIFFGEKFCEYEYLEIPYIRDMLKTLGVETLLLELGADDLDNLMPHRTRIEAFAEMLKAASLTSRSAT